VGSEASSCGAPLPRRRGASGGPRIELAPPREPSQPPRSCRAHAYTHISTPKKYESKTFPSVHLSPCTSAHSPPAAPSPPRVAPPTPPQHIFPSRRRRFHPPVTPTLHSRALLHHLPPPPPQNVVRWRPRTRRRRIRRCRFTHARDPLSTESAITLAGPFSFSRRITAAGPPQHRPSSCRPKGKQ
jgi:hypothetical protein